MTEVFNDLCRLLGLGTVDREPDLRQVQSLLAAAAARIVDTQTAMAALESGAEAASASGKSAPDQ